MPPVAYPHLPLGRIDRESPGQSEFGDLLRIDGGNIRVLALCKSPNRDGMIIRLQETSGDGGESLVEVLRPEITMKLAFRPFEIKTVAIEKSGNWRETPLC
jgi:hypothetical protein